MILALRYYKYLLSLPETRLVHAALREAQALWLEGEECWLKDVIEVVKMTAPEWPTTGDSFTSLEGVDDMIAGIEKWTRNGVLTNLHNSKKLAILQRRYPKPPLTKTPTDVFHLPCTHPGPPQIPMQTSHFLPPPRD
ncbi:hypothetical protein AAF712_007585 [Marasmius tenuissimus]|uniref:Uncharacterized protein n=1 Tax=Marasmius tenuissimus TaxID=585030 RepID=A0ABR2ZX62_9AGAR